MQFLDFLVGRRRGDCVGDCHLPSGARCYSPIVRITLLSGRVLFDDSLSSCASISSYFGTVVTSDLGAHETLEDHHADSDCIVRSISSARSRSASISVSTRVSASVAGLPQLLAQPLCAATPAM